MRSINCVYVTNKYMLPSMNMRDVFDDHFYFNVDEYHRRISKTDQTNETLSIEAVNAYIYKKMQRAITVNDYRVIYYVIRNLEKGVVEDVKEMIRHIHGPYFEFNFFMSEEDVDILPNLPCDLYTCFDNLIVFDKEEHINRRYAVSEEIDFDKIKMSV